MFLEINKYQSTFNFIEKYICMYIYIYIDQICSVAFSPDGKYLASAAGTYKGDNKDFSVNLIEVESRNIHHKFVNIHSSNNIYTYIYTYNIFLFSNLLTNSFFFILFFYYLILQMLYTVWLFHLMVSIQLLDHGITQ